MEREGKKSNLNIKMIFVGGQIIVGGVLAVLLVLYLYRNISNRLFVPVFIVTPVALLVFLNLLSTKVNFPAIIKSFGFCTIVFQLLLFIGKPYLVYRLAFRELPRILGIVGAAVIFILFFIILLKKFSTSIMAAIGTGIVLGFYLPALFWNINTMYDESSPVIYTGTVKRVLTDHGSLGGSVELVKTPVEGMSDSIYLHCSVSEYVKGDEISIVYHQGLFKVGWCEIENNHQ